MKKLLLTIITALLLTACSSGDIKSQTKQPKIPTEKTMQASILNVTNLKTSDAQKPITSSENQNIDVEKLVVEINKNIEQESITAGDIERGWYFAESKQDKKWGTPDSWDFVNDGSQSRFISPNAVEAVSDIKVDELCKKTAGTYLVSCIEREVTYCEHIPQSECKCIEDSKWVKDQGCILTKGKNFVKISPEELQQGWYYGLNSEKKLDTPSSWVWAEGGQKSKWQNK